MKAVVLEWRDRSFRPADMEPMDYQDAELTAAALCRVMHGHYVPVFLDRLVEKGIRLST